MHRLQNGVPVRPIHLHFVFHQKRQAVSGCLQIEIRYGCLAFGLDIVQPASKRARGAEGPADGREDAQIGFFEGKGAVQRRFTRLLRFPGAEVTLGHNLARRFGVPQLCLKAHRAVHSGIGQSNLVQSKLQGVPALVLGCNDQPGVRDQDFANRYGGPGLRPSGAFRSLTAFPFGRYDDLHSVQDHLGHAFVWQG